MTRDLTELLDLELKDTIKALLAQPRLLSLDDLPASRKASKEMWAKMRTSLPDIPSVVSEDRLIPGPEGSPDVKVRIYRPARQFEPLPCLLWIHGGGYLLGDIDQEDLTSKQLVLAAECVAVSVEYRLAPENPYPAPLEDCYTALKWLSDNAEECRIDSRRIAIGGASAGGGLAAGLAILARDRKQVNVIFQLLIYPMINDCNTAAADDALPDTILWTRESNMMGWRSYLGCEPGGEGIDCYAAAYRGTDMDRLPPAYIAVGDLDLFAQEDVEYARRLIAAGVPTELHVYPGACHAFDVLVPGANISKRFVGDLRRALKTALHRDRP